MDHAKTQPRIAPRKPVDRLTEALERFLHIQASSGLVLLAATAIALTLANSPWADSFAAFWETPVGLQFGEFEVSHSLKHWINDGLMVIFFFVIGMEVKRELVLGELREPRKAALPVAAALGGMIVPAALYLAVQFGQPAERGWGIPMATDIAFVVGCMAILGDRVPYSLRIMLLSLAIVDDLGAILVIAIGYTETIHTDWLLLAGGGVGLALVARWMGVRNLGFYALLGVVIWFAVHESGVHATIAGVVLGLLTPTRSYVGDERAANLVDRMAGVVQADDEAAHHRAKEVRRLRWATRETISPLEYLIGTLHPWVGFVIMPLFALANAGVPIDLASMADSVALAVLLGLALGKPLGIVAVSWLAVRLKLARMPESLNWKLILGGGCLSGIGFTMALFIAGLALADDMLLLAKVGVLTGSLVSAVVGMTLLWTMLPQLQSTSWQEAD